MSPTKPHLRRCDFPVPIWTRSLEGSHVNKFDNFEVEGFFLGGGEGQQVGSNKLSFHFVPN